MTPCNIPKASETTMMQTGALCPQAPGNVIEEETQWRQRPQHVATTTAEPRIVATRWRSFEEGTRVVSAETPPDYSVIGIVMRNLNVCLSVSGRIARNGPATSGTLLVTRPAVRAHCVFRGPFDVLHLHGRRLMVVRIIGSGSVGAGSWDSRSEDVRTPIQDHELDAMVYDPS